MCYRYRAKPSEYRQVYSGFKPIEEKGKPPFCDAYWELSCDDLLEIPEGKE